MSLLQILTVIVAAFQPHVQSRIFKRRPFARFAVMQRAASGSDR